MNTQAIINAAIAALELAENLLPTISDLVKSGEVSIEDQAKVRAKFESLRDKTGGQFEGDHWKVQP